MKKQKSTVEEFVDTIKDDPERLIKWAEKEIRAYEEFIRIIKKGRKLKQSKIK